MENKPNKELESLYARAADLTHRPRKYFAFVESVEDYREEKSRAVFARFDCITFEDGRWFSHAERLSDAVLSETPFVQIECLSPLQNWRAAFGADESILELEDQWIIVETRTPATGLVANEFYNGVGMELLHSLVRLEPTEEEQEILDGLKGKFDLNDFPISSKSQIDSILNNAFASFDQIIISDVGQGNLNFMTLTGIPKIYFDLGGGTGINQSTYPNGSTIVTCKSQNPLVILSHWDMDHIETAVRDSSNCTLHWIVPLQRVGKIHYTLALRLFNNNKLTIWPSGYPLSSNTLGDVIKCAGASKNDSGLAMCVKINTDQVLLPGDAAYSSIPTVTGYNLSCLVASHHGSISANANVPKGVSNGWVAYSFGQKNTYYHPNKKTVSSHTSQGWNVAKDTTLQSITFAKTNYQCPCRGMNCNLSTAQHY